MMAGQRVAIFIDVQNMFYSAKHQYSRKLDFAKLLTFIVNGRTMVRAIAYVIQAGDVDQSSFINFLKLNGFEVRSKELKVRPDGSTKGDWDMGIAIDSLTLSRNVERKFLKNLFIEIDFHNILPRKEKKANITANKGLMRYV